MPSKQRKELLPTSAKSPYTFSLRDVSMVLQGFCQGTSKARLKSDGRAKAWRHERERVFWDRLATEADHDWLFSKLKSAMNERLKKEFDQLGRSADPVILIEFAVAKSTAYLKVVNHAREVALHWEKKGSVPKHFAPCCRLISNIKNNNVAFEPSSQLLL